MRAVLLFSFLVPALSLADAQFYKEPLKDIAEFLGLGEVATRTYHGRTESGTPCRLGITKLPHRIVFSPLSLRGAPAVGISPKDAREAQAFIVQNTTQYDVNGGTEDNHLWASYCIDDRQGDFVIHGQFCMGFRLDLKTDGAGGFKEASYSKTHHQDLGFEPKGRMECRNLKLVR